MKMRVIPEGSGHVVVTELVHVVMVFPRINLDEDIVAWVLCRDVGSVSVQAVMEETWDYVRNETQKETSRSTAASYFVELGRWYLLCESGPENPRGRCMQLTYLSSNLPPCATWMVGPGNPPLKFLMMVEKEGPL